MEQITGRIVKDAEVRRTKDNREFVIFTVVVNDYYKPKNGEEKKESRFFNCSYWLSTKIQPALKKGGIVSVFGKVNVNAYKGSDGEYHASLTFHANHIDIISGAKKDGAAPAQDIQASPTGTAPAGMPETKDDLPF